MQCHYAWQGSSVLKTFSGFITGDFFISTAEEVSADGRFDALKIIYNDFLLIDGHSIDVKTYARVAICRLGAMATNPNFRVAFIARPTHASELEVAVRPLARGAPFDPMIFRSLTEASNWFEAQPALDAPREHSWSATPSL